MYVPAWATGLIGVWTVRGKREPGPINTSGIPYSIAYYLLGQRGQVVWLLCGLVSMSGVTTSVACWANYWARGHKWCFAYERAKRPQRNMGAEADAADRDPIKDAAVGSGLR